MKRTYHLSGMSCKGCQARLTHLLSGVSGVQQVQVDLEKAAAVIVMETPIAVATFQAVLPAQYQLIEKEEEDLQNAKGYSQEFSTPGSTLQQLRPLFLILAYIAIAAWMRNWSQGGLAGFMFDFMGLFYIVFSFFKILGLKEFPEAFGRYDPLAKVFPWYGWAYPFIEVGLGLLFLMRFQLDFALWATVIVLGITTIGVAQSLLDQKTIHCACLGTVLKLPMTKATLIENALMLFMAFWMLLMA